MCWAGVALSVLLVLNVFQRLCLFLLFVLYLSLYYAGQIFMSYQWDLFLLEMGFAAFLLSFATMPGILLLRWLMFRFMFMSGGVKLLSLDPSWWNLSALEFHFFTQPLPTPLAWYAAQLPAGFLTFATGTMFVIELVSPVPDFRASPAPLRRSLQLPGAQFFIFPTGNYNWFNFQTMLLCLPLFDDAALRSVLPRWLAEPRPKPTTPRRAVTVAVSAIAVLIVFCSLVRMDQRFGGQPPAFARTITGWVGPFQIVSGYGLFAVMTTQRREIVIEGSHDGIEWHEYEFRYKPGDLMRAPLWNIPHQPRLDWQMWFAALDNPQRLRRFWRFLERLLENEPTVTALLEKNPFADKAPLYVRAQFSTTHLAPACRNRPANGGTVACWGSTFRRCISRFAAASEAYDYPAPRLGALEGDEDLIVLRPRADGDGKGHLLDHGEIADRVFRRDDGRHAHLLVGKHLAYGTKNIRSGTSRRYRGKPGSRATTQVPLRHKLSPSPTFQFALTVHHREVRSNECLLGLT